ncbi:hypothetical protein PIB30_063922 [Stylosanthes scabra]|uniref:Uncharacterized protein n=1 Tax=Stylosanthes scabra TaxID=79078 RepID=A0ABU6WJS9_9FABA|nr:hypothetical protein [Stylosanthes scabra]
MKPWQHDEGKVWPFRWVSRRRKIAVLSGLTKEQGEGVNFHRELAREGFEKGKVGQPVVGWQQGMGLCQMWKKAIAQHTHPWCLVLSSRCSISSGGGLVPLKRLCGEVVVITDMLSCCMEKLLQHIKGRVLLRIGFKREVAAGCMDSDSKRVAWDHNVESVGHALCYQGNLLAEVGGWQKGGVVADLCQLVLDANAHQKGEGGHLVDRNQVNPCTKQNGNN